MKLPQRGPVPSKQTLEILKLLDKGYSYSRIAEQYGISKQRVGQIAQRHEMQPYPSEKPIDSIPQQEK